MKLKLQKSITFEIEKDENYGFSSKIRIKPHTT